MLVGAEGFVLKVKVRSAKVPDQDGLILLLEAARPEMPRLSHLWLDAGYEGRGKRWAQESLSLSVEVVRKPSKPVPEKVAKEWAKEGEAIEWQRLIPPRGFKVLPRRWVVERTFSWLGQNRRMSKNYERLPEGSEAFVYAAMTRALWRDDWPVSKIYWTVAPSNSVYSLRSTATTRHPGPCGRPTPP